MKTLTPHQLQFLTTLIFQIGESDLTEVERTKIYSECDIILKFNDMPDSTSIRFDNEGSPYNVRKDVYIANVDYIDELAEDATDEQAKEHFGRLDWVFEAPIEDVTYQKIYNNLKAI